MIRKTMNIEFDKGKKVDADIAFLLVFKDSKINLPKPLQDELNNAIKSKRFTGKFKESIIFPKLTKEQHTTLAIIGIGNQKKFTSDTLRKIGGYIANLAKSYKAKSYAVDIDLILHKDHDKEYCVQSLCEGSILGLYKFDKYKSKMISSNGYKEPEKLTIVTKEKINPKVLSKAKIISESVMLTRDLVNMPPSDLIPKDMVNISKELAKKYGFSIKVLGKKELEKKKCGGILGVSRGSDKEPFMIILSLNKEPGNGSTAIIGKGVTFDAGGMDIKPADGMFDMKCDMGGAGTVLGIMTALARLGVKKNIIGIMGCTENMLGPDAYKPGDILTSYSGKTIEIKNTDAEGRLVLADAITIAEKDYNAKQIIDMATLTGAQLVALGFKVSAVITNNDGFYNKLKVHSDKTEELIWQLPNYNHYKHMVDSDIADVSNLGKPQRIAGTITAGTFLQRFVDKAEWIHLDIAGPAYNTESNEYIQSGATGWGVRLLTSYFE